MSAESAPMNLTHHFLIAMPGVRDSLFARSVVYVCEHNERGTLGLIVNKLSDITLGQLFDKLDLPLQRADLATQPVLQGGPVQTDRGFVLHEVVQASAVQGGQEQEPDETLYASTLRIPGGMEMTTSKDVLEALSTGGGPQRLLITLGYSAWGEGQLESELRENAWLTVGADLAVLFDTPVPERYGRALALLGLQSWMLTAEAGHA
ncbi:YqgE/AlgH family protein [Extensimonas sp. H3M7-6]|uniref:YqgE/AlgH family protein n=1 Tax=Extensimonas soli TaxID=3031322 RepID=UPI0023DA894F|nr:YqgE/AlgH family protein [Extensimonas sp. H3M7-6]MDF1482382.1 YqgE/AlgH family protein [Extensimonas sp. H3M7-6]